MRGPGRRMAVSVARWSLPAALLLATLVAVLGLGGTLFSPAPTSPAPPSAALDLSGPPTPADAAHPAGCCR
jgi:ABC-type enterobactin transport system permease subunit